MRDKVSISAVSAAAGEFNARTGAEHLNCGESVIAALWDAFRPDFPRELAVTAGAGMGRGIGGSGCVCGSLNGGVTFIGLMTGDKLRAKPLAARLHDAFRAGTGRNVTCCRVLTRGMEWGSPERRAQCQGFCELAAGLTARILCEELGVRAEE
ncbi:C-GCAxxG-C-C family (seleno)protein [Olsenella profusa]|uniref:C-GCAxxG-C-C family protein n=1 Tax=Olsenella profusa TaxID=138595 RepID=A0ABS2F3P7_9ACTN|nr:C-GCAxxG-C-C family protein [Olsenella profusa]